MNIAVNWRKDIWNWTLTKRGWLRHLVKINNLLYFNINVPRYSVQNETVNMDNENFNPIEKSAVSLNYSENPAIIDLNAENPVELHTLDHLEEKNISMALFSWY